MANTAGMFGATVPTKKRPSPAPPIRKGKGKGKGAKPAGHDHPAPKWEGPPAPAAMDDHVEDEAAKRARLQETAAMKILKLKTLPGQQEDKFTDLVIISVDGSLLENARSDEQREKNNVAWKISGRYWNLGMIDGSAVYRQEPPQNSSSWLNSEQVFLWRNGHMKEVNHSGWYIAKSMSLEKKEFESEGNIYAWCPSRPSAPQTFPEVAHIPHWCKTQHQAVSIKSGVVLLHELAAAAKEGAQTHKWLIGQLACSGWQTSSDWKAFAEAIMVATEMSVDLNISDEQLNWWIINASEAAALMETGAGL
ncbi:unnamed protein product [Prorocentrum cordatum]|uniref:Uncharacterized protein n=1 Tax=Prorocentrum cordatum TaxID=2364126 RepID=A0ABN9V032_9DINO|nr:unnamed protein product [Polarella glacialis]